MDCPQCDAPPGQCHRRGCDLEQCACCGLYRSGCECPESAVARVPWAGSCLVLDACLEFGFFGKDLYGLWLLSHPDDPDAVPDLARLLRRCRWDASARRFERRPRACDA